jgi:Fe-S-cluster containining protein
MDEARSIFRVRLDVRGTALEVAIPLPAEPVTVAQLVPLLHALDDRLIAVVTGALARAGTTISCRAGCGACCRQMVPVSESEARHLGAVIAAMPAERRAIVEARFAAARAALAERGVPEPPDLEDAEAVKRFSLRYFRSGVACPFLENESCSIHEHRPLACREHLVTSPAERCAHPETESVEAVLVSKALALLLYRFADGVGDDEVRWMPLVEVLEWLREQPPAPSFDAERLLHAFFGRFAAAIEGRRDA